MNEPSPADKVQSRLTRRAASFKPELPPKLAALLVAAAQSSTSFIPPLSEEKAQVLTLNLRNRMIFKAADEAGAVESADFLGQRKTRQKTTGYSGDQATRSYTNVEEH